MQEWQTGVAGLDAIIDLIIGLDDQGRIAWLRGRFASEHRPADLDPLLGTPLEQLEASLPNPVETEPHSPAFHRTIRFALHVGGESHRFEGVFSPCQGEGGCRMILAGRIPQAWRAGIAQRLRIERRQAGARDLLHEVNQQILAGAELPEIYDMVVQNLRALTESPLVWFGERRPDGSVAVVAASGQAGPYLQRIRIRWDESPEGNGPVGRAIRLGEPQIVADASLPVMAPWWEGLRHFGLRFCMAVPVQVEGEIIGAITLYRAQEGAPGPDLIAEMLSFATQLGVALRLARANAQMRLHALILRHSTNGVLVADRNGVIEWVNPAFTRLTGYTLDDAKGSSPRILKSGLHSPEFYQDLWATICAGRVWQGEMTNRRKDGSLYIDQMTIIPMVGAGGSITHFAAIKTDMTARYQYQTDLERLHSHDPLTHLLNRRTFLDLLQIRTAIRDRNGTLVLLDLDNFALVNEELGFQGGDLILAELAQLLQEWTGPGDIVAYLGQDEFGLLLTATGPEAMRLSEQIREALAVHTFSVDGHRLHLTGSLGLTRMQQDGDHVELLNAASAAVDAAKGRGKNCSIGCMDMESKLPQSDLSRWALRVRQGLEANRFRLLYQPIIDLTNGTVLAHEALIRLMGDDGDLISPGSFLPAAERHWLMPYVDEWVLTEVVCRLKDDPSLRIFMNISPQTLATARAMERLATLIEVCPLVTSRLTVEITESVGLHNFEAIRQWIDRMRQAGVQFALDDLGAGFSSFTYLANIPVDVVKIDGAFVQDLQQSRVNQAMVRAMAMAAGEIGVKVVVEQVESLTDLAMLRSMGVQYGQGYAFGRPGPLE